jgi:hypothetical protein
MKGEEVLHELWSDWNCTTVRISELSNNRILLGSASARLSASTLLKTNVFIEVVDKTWSNEEGLHLLRSKHWRADDDSNCRPALPPVTDGHHESGWACRVTDARKMTYALQSRRVDDDSPSIWLAGGSSRDPRKVEAQRHAPAHPIPCPAAAGCCWFPVRMVVSDTAAYSLRGAMSDVARWMESRNCSHLEF